jgi:hypothetical protein
VAQITQEFDEPFAGDGGGSPSPLPSSFSPSVIGIAGTPYLIDTESGRYVRQSIDVVQQRNTNDARDLLLLPQDVWRQQIQSWNLGAGQSNLDRDDSLLYRYESSFGIDPWTNKWQFQLLTKSALLNGTGSLSGNVWLTQTSNYLAVINSTAVRWYDTLSVGSASIGSTAPPTGYTITDIANGGYQVMVLANNGSQAHIYTTTGPGGTWSQWSSTNFGMSTTFIEWEKDYLIVGEGNVLKSATQSGAAATVYTHPDASFRWYDAASGNSCIYVLGRAADRTTIHRVAIKEDGTGLAPAIVAANLPDGEIGYSISSYLGFICIGTDKGVRIATPNNTAGDLTLGPIIPTANPVYCFEGQDRFIWYGNSGMDSAYIGAGTVGTPAFPTTCTGLGRMDLSATTTSQLTPAYANDLAVLTIPNAVVRSIATFQNKRVFSIDGHGVYFETNEHMDAGWLKEGTMSFSVEDLKTALYLQAKWKPLTGKIGLDISYDDTAFARVATMQIQDSIRSTNVSLGGNQFSRVNAREVLIRDPAQPYTTPIFTRWEIRAIPAKGRAAKWTLPIMNYEDIEIDMVKYTRDPLAVLDTLVGLATSGQIFSLQESGQSYQVHVKEYAWQPEKLTINGRAWQGVFTLVVEEVA